MGWIHSSGGEANQVGWSDQNPSTGGETITMKILDDKWFTEFDEIKVDWF